MFTDMKRKKQVVAQTLAIRDLTDASYLLYVSLFDIATTKQKADQPVLFSDFQVKLQFYSEKFAEENENEFGKGDSYPYLNISPPIGTTIQHKYWIIGCMNGK